MPNPPPSTAPLLARADHHAPSVFQPDSLLREARRQKGLAPGSIPPVCLLDPDGDIVRHLHEHRGATASAVWACYHTQLWEWRQSGRAFGAVGCAVGPPFAVLVAEQLFVSGCELLISITSAGRIGDGEDPSSYMIIERALRDEGTSYHYQPPATFAQANPDLLALAASATAGFGTVRVGTSWTTDAPFRETAEIIEQRRSQGVTAVEMEAAALYAFAEARSRPVICLAHITNSMGQVEGDFEKGEANGAEASLAIAAAIAGAWTSRRGSAGPERPVYGD